MIKIDILPTQNRGILMSYKTTRIAAMLAIGVLLAAAFATGVIDSLAKKSLRQAAKDAGYQSIGAISQNNAGYGVARHLRAKTGTCQVLIYRRDTDHGYWYVTYYGKEQLSSDATLLTAQDAAVEVTRLTGRLCAA